MLSHPVMNNNAAPARIDAIFLLIRVLSCEVTFDKSGT
jgi:hypothetical protein